jgi:hypothetical protein
MLGKSCPNVDSIIDYPAKLLGGRKHRAYLHDYPSAFVAGLLADASLVGGLAGLIHVFTDNSCTANKQLEQLLRVLAKKPSRRNH